MNMFEEITKFQEFFRKFHDRHEFDQEEFNVLKSNFPKIKFGKYFPLAWIYPVDVFLRKFGNDIVEVECRAGLLAIKQKSNSEFIKKNILKLKDMVEILDADIRDYDPYIGKFFLISNLIKEIKYAMV